MADLDWVLGEFDASFNELAIASLRYHLDYSYADNEIHRMRFESLIDRLSEPEPTYDELEGFVDDGTGGFRDVVDPETGASRFAYEPSAHVREYAERFEQAHAEHQRRITAARHEFVDVIPLLWS